MSTVRIGASEFALEDVLDNPGQYVRQLERAKTTQGWAECGCSQRRPRPRLQIRRHGPIFLLALWPDQVHQHAVTCHFHRRAGSKRASATDSLDAFRTRDGHHDVRLDASLWVSTRTPTTRTRPTGKSAKPPRRSAGLLAFLEFAWEQAGLNVWPGTGGRSWNACWSHLITELADCRINGKPADGMLHVMQRWDPARKTEILAELDAWQARLTPTKDTSPRGILIGEIESHEPTQFGGKLVLRQSLLRYFMSGAVYQRLQRSHATALAGIGKTEQRCIAILLVEKSKANYLTVVDAAAMLANRQFLPCDSSYEIAMADRLVALERSFLKPLRHIGQAAVHPDFVLTDVTPEVVIEVLGMSGNPQYDTHLAEKRAHYQANRIPCIEWTPAAEELANVTLPMPATISEKTL
ncbi:DUF1173 family protein [Cupriavidus numazuensis]|uniref:DUF1173 domain-containing protein n=1 Tax=Cupriavidus numazuensis TaxID=221992 RepID=A0ABM8TTP2_9BURK|nr:DUF1173 family protein [Cupriavidus numazuensis]CAG2159734.1 hypothetical protein LMG26411_06938 [Cupriavidus numazuensis]